MNGYICHYRGKKIEVYADTTLQAQTKAAEQFKAKKRWEVSVVLAELGGKPVTHVPSNQTGDNSFTGGAYGHRFWAVAYLSRESVPSEVAAEIADELGESIAQAY